jgi:predicted transcriptional regulator
MIRSVLNKLHLILRNRICISLEIKSHFIMMARLDFTSLIMFMSLHYKNLSRYLKILSDNYHIKH